MDGCQACEDLAPDHGHLNKVAHWSRKFARELFVPGSVESRIAAEWGCAAGLLHDLGKFSPPWQAYLRKRADGHHGEVSGRIDHSTAGAKHIISRDDLMGRLLAYAIAGHHAGLPNGIGESDAALEARVRRVVSNVGNVPPDLLNADFGLRPPPFALASSRSLAFFVRMVFSCLVDADFLATEAFMAPDRTQIRNGVRPDLETLERHLDAFHAVLRSNDTPVNRIRDSVRAECTERASELPGLFSLTVPTGGGKTLSSLAFAVKHARRHGLRRVVYVMPFTAIIEQNAAVFRRVFGGLDDDVVVEHHSGLDPAAAHATDRSRLLAENWDAPIIVTTTVQFFESLYSDRPGRCRKLHNLAQSVIVLDEAQALPIPVLDPCLRAIEELTTNYGSSVVLCTATQPAFDRSDTFAAGLSGRREIVASPLALHESMRRVKFANLGVVSREELLMRLRSERQVLCVVSTRREARDLHEALRGEQGAFHLSALMCPEHRSARLDEVQRLLSHELPVRLISTQVIEAGVDIDFPAVYRLKAGLDSIAQAAGRCDREGRRTAEAGSPGGRFYLFDFGELPPPGFLRQAAYSTSEVAGRGVEDLLSLEAVQEYFRIHFWRHSDSMDVKQVASCWPARSPSLMESPDELFLFRFRDCGMAFRLIDEASMPVVIPYGHTGAKLCAELRRTDYPGYQRLILRRLQRFVVTVSPAEHGRLTAAGALERVADAVDILLRSDFYSDEVGLHTSLSISPSNDILIV
jgi:CRISPR-associated endonuclease/helicase Cas3